MPFVQVKAAAGALAGPQELARAEPRTGRSSSGERPGRLLDPSAATDHLDRLYRAAWALCRSREGAEDLVQDTYARVLSRPRFVRNDDDLGYLLRAMRNTFVSQRRRAAHQAAFAAPDELDRIEDATAPQPQDAAEARLVHEAIAALPDNFRAALVAVDVVGLRYNEAARALRIREATLTTRLFRARKRVAEMLAPAPAAASERGVARVRGAVCCPAPRRLGDATT